MKKIIFVLSLIFIISILYMTLNPTIEAKTVLKAQIKAAEGECYANIYGLKWIKAYSGLKLYENSMIRTKDNSYVEIIIGGENTLKVAENSEIQIKELRSTMEERKAMFFLKKKVPTDLVKLKVIKGSLLSKVQALKRDNKFEVKTPVAVCGVRGTEFDVEHQDKTKVSVLKGKVDLFNPDFPDEVISINPNEFSTVGFGAKPAEAQFMSDADLNKIKLFSEKKIKSEVTVQKPDPEFTSYNYSEDKDNKLYTYEVTVKNIDRDEVNVLVLIYRNYEDVKNELVGKYPMDFVEGSSDYESPKKFKKSVKIEKPGKYFYRFQIEKK